MELFDSKDDFGGRALMLVGDLLQLPPVRATSIYNQPKSHKNKVIYNITDESGENTGNLWKNCQVVVLKTNFRQGNGNPWTELLNRVRIGEATAEQFAKKGANIVLVARRKEKLEQVEKKLSKYSTKIFLKTLKMYLNINNIYFLENVF